MDAGQRMMSSGLVLVIAIAGFIYFSNPNTQAAGEALSALKGMLKKDQLPQFAELQKRKGYQNYYYDLIWTKQESDAVKGAERRLSYPLVRKFTYEPSLSAMKMSGDRIAFTLSKDTSASAWRVVEIKATYVDGRSEELLAHEK